MIQMVHVSKTFPSQVCALSDITLEISQGEFAFIAGPSGSGKTTLLRILFGAERPTRGEAFVNGIPITEKGCSNLSRLRRTMGIIFQDAKLLRDKTAGENIALALEATGYFGREVKQRVAEALAEVGLENRERDAIFSLSAGEQQRVAIARALINNPPLLLADEPTGNLDAHKAGEVMDIFSHLHQKGATVVFATHDVDLVQRYPFRRIHLLGGMQVDSESTEDRGTRA
jgi:cell division transport system ATP-binding protein